MRRRRIDLATSNDADSLRRVPLREQLMERAIRYGDRDLEFAAEWFPLEEEAWRRLRK